MKTFFKAAIAASALLFTGPAFSADVTAPVTKAPPPAPALVAYDWSGIYVGGHIGGGWSATSFADPGAAQNLANCCFQAFFAPGAAATTANASSFLGGAQAGWMYQIGKLVVGGDFDWSATGMKGHGSGFFPPSPGSTAKAIEAYSVDTKWTATATTTIGFAKDRWMYYGKAGAALADNGYGLNVAIPSNDFASSFNLPSPGVNAIVTGWTVGAGVKWAFSDNWFANVEYDFLDFGSKAQNFSFVCQPSPCTPGGSPSGGTWNPTFNQYISEVKVGLNYKFDPGLVGPGDLTAPFVFAKLTPPVLTKAPPTAPALAAYDWSGVYVGGHIGGGWSTSTFVDPGAAQILANCCVLNGLQPGAAATNANRGSFLGGAQAGWMYQIGRLVVGNDFDWSSTSFKGRGSGFFPPAPLGAANNCTAPCNATEAYSVDTKWTATATTTIGVAKDRWMLYNKAGVALADNSYGLGVTGTTSGAGVTAGPFSLISPSVNAMVAGWTVGTGVKWALSDNWFANAEYDYLEFGSKAQNIGAVCSPSPCPALLNGVTTATFNPTFNQHISEVKVGLNYKFDPGFTGPASAGLTAPRIAKAPLASAGDWSGVYVGGHVGGGWSTTSFVDPGAAQTLANCCELTNLAPGAAATNANASAFLGGAQAGWMYQIGKLVVGGDFDWSATGMKGHGSGFFPPSTTGGISSATEAYSVDTKWTATSTTTIGFARDRWMYYGKGGAAFADNSYGLGVTGNFGAAGFSLTSPNVNDIIAGWTVGTGVKWAFSDNWFVNVEYDFLDFGSKAQNLSAVCTPSPCVPAVNTVTNATFNPTFDQHISEVKVGLNYKFSPGFLFW